MLREQDKHFLASLYAAVAIIFTWKGIWEGIYEIPYIGDPFVFLFIGLAMLTFSGLVFNEFDPLGNVQKGAINALQKVQRHPKKDEFEIKYLDKNKKEHITTSAKHLHKVEEDTVIFTHPTQKREFYVPLHRISEIIHNGKTYWRF